jgi:tRNA threonylcarbamoyl adenosine modification protein YeaZ
MTNHDLTRVELLCEEAKRSRLKRSASQEYLDKGTVPLSVFLGFIGILVGFGAQSGLDGPVVWARVAGVEGDAILMLETSMPQASVALVTADGRIEQRFFQSDRSHNALLFGPLSELLTDGVRVGLVLVGSGPGSYSGTRVGIAAAQGVGVARSCLVAAVPSVLAVDEIGSESGMLIIGDARRGTWWTASTLHRRMIEAPSLVDERRLREAVAAAIDAGCGVATMEPSAYPLDPDLARAVRRVAPTAAGLWMAWSAADEVQRQAWMDEPPRPIYLKPPHITPARRH